MTSFNLTRETAADRAAHLTVTSYTIHLDVTQPTTQPDTAANDALTDAPSGISPSPTSAPTQPFSSTASPPVTPRSSTYAVHTYSPPPSMVNPST
ncbi:MAG: hypothetical protein U1U88_002163 [Lawsonella clevelandensis]